MNSSALRVNKYLGDKLQENQIGGARSINGVTREECEIVAGHAERMKLFGKATRKRKGPMKVELQKQNMRVCGTVHPNDSS
jgi:hypothetical protein